MRRTSQSIDKSSYVVSWLMADGRPALEEEGR